MCMQPDLSLHRQPMKTVENKHFSCLGIIPVFLSFYKGKRLLWLTVSFPEDQPIKNGVTVKILNIGTYMSEQTV